MFKIRRSTFETNSSSTHVVGILSKKEVEKFKNNKIFLDFEGEPYYSNPGKLFVVDLDYVKNKWLDYGKNYYIDYSTIEEFIKEEVITFEKLSKQNPKIDWEADKVIIDGWWKP